jgi:hypothetical protein
MTQTSSTAAVIKTQIDALRTVRAELMVIEHLASDRGEWSTRNAVNIQSKCVANTLASLCYCLPSTMQIGQYDPRLWTLASETHTEAQHIECSRIAEVK